MKADIVPLAEGRLWKMKMKATEKKMKKGRRNDHTAL
jgi:hypothetical protein